MKYVENIYKQKRNKINNKGNQQIQTTGSGINIKIITQIKGESRSSN